MKTDNAGKATEFIKQLAPNMKEQFSDGNATLIIKNINQTLKLRQKILKIN
jgi:hypothetical protein